MHQPVQPTPPVIRFYKLKTNEDIVAFELENLDGLFRIRRPLSISVDNEVMGGRQLLNVREWVPPIVCSTDEIYLPKEYVMFSTDVKESFKEEFIHATEYLYSVESVKKSRTTKSDNVIPLMLKDPSTKPN
jgi:hypothetical protein